MATTTTRQNECREALLKILKPGDTVYTVIRSVSRSGMSRRLDLYTIQDNRPRFLTTFTADLLGLSYGTESWIKGAGLRVSGCGMDMGFAVVYNLSTVLFGDGYKLNHEWI